MKRTFDQTTKDQPNPDEEGKDDGLSGKTLYGIDGKRRKLSTQRLGDFIVKAKDAVHFKIVSSVEQIDSEGSESFFEPKFLYWVSLLCSMLIHLDLFAAIRRGREDFWLRELVNHDLPQCSATDPLRPDFL